MGVGIYRSYGRLHDIPEKRRMKGHFSSFLTGIIFLSFATLSPLLAQAQSTEGIEIKPGVTEDRVNPGDTYRFSLRVKNVSATEQTFFIEKRDISGQDDQGRPIFAEDGQATDYELSSWITSAISSVTLSAGETQSVAFVAHVPKGATPGSHFGGIFFTAEAPKAEGSGAGIGFQVGSIISLRINGDTTEDARLREFSTERMVYNSANVNFNVRIENLGNVLLRPHGLIDITDMRGKKVATVTVNDTAAPVFPATDRRYVPTWNYDSFAIGRYQAVLSLVYGEDGRKTVSSITSFWVLPVKPILTILGTLLGLMVLLYVMIRVYVRKKLREMGVDSSKGADSEYYMKKYNKSASRMMVMLSAIFLFCIACLIILFLMFA